MAETDTRTIYDGMEIDMGEATGSGTLVVSVTTDDGNVDTITIAVDVGDDPSAALVAALQQLGYTAEVNGNVTPDGTTPLVTIGTKSDPEAPGGTVKVIAIDAKWQPDGETTWIAIRTYKIANNQWT